MQEPLTQPPTLTLSHYVMQEPLTLTPTLTLSHYVMQEPLTLTPTPTLTLTLTPHPAPAWPQVSAATTYAEAMHAHPVQPADPKLAVAAA